MLKSNKLSKANVMIWNVHKPPTKGGQGSIRMSFGMFHYTLGFPLMFHVGFIGNILVILWLRIKKHT